MKKIQVLLLLAVFMTLPLGATKSKYLLEEPVGQVQLEIEPYFVPPESDLFFSNLIGLEFSTYDLSSVYRYQLAISANEGYRLPETMEVMIDDAWYTVPTNGGACPEGIHFALEDEKQGVLVILQELFEQNPSHLQVFAEGVPVEPEVTPLPALPVTPPDTGTAGGAESGTDAGNTLPDTEGGAPEPGGDLAEGEHGESSDLEGPSDDLEEGQEEGQTDGTGESSENVSDDNSQQETTEGTPAENDDEEETQADASTEHDAEESNESETGDASTGDSNGEGETASSDASDDTSGQDSGGGDASAGDGDTGASGESDASATE